MNKRALPGLLPCALAAAALSACGPAVGTGSLSIRASGEEAAKTGIPVTAGDERIEFADGWSVKFDKYLVGVGRVRVESSDTSLPESARVAVASDEVAVADLTRGDPEIFRFDGLETRRWDRFSFEVTAPDAATPAANGVSAEDVARMVAGGFNYWIEGTATKGDRTVTFAWGLRNPSRNSRCTNGGDSKEGVVVSAGSETEAEITFHVEHLFWTALGGEDKELRFEPIAAKADGDGVVSLEALESQLASDPRDADGAPILDSEGNAVFYDPASVPFVSNPPHLREFLHKVSAGQAHLNGGGLCTISAL